MTVSALHIWIWGFSPILPCRFAQALSSRIGSVGEQRSSSLSTDSQWDLSLGFVWATQVHSRSCSEAIPVLLWLYDWGHCPVGTCMSGDHPSHARAAYRETVPRRRSAWTRTTQAVRSILQ